MKTVDWVIVIYFPMKALVLLVLWDMGVI